MNELQDYHKSFKPKIACFTMGRIKSKLVKRTTRTILKGENKFTGDFETNKNSLKGAIESKKIRNQIAGYAVRLKKQKQIEE